MPRVLFTSKCPACNNNDNIIWHHKSCPKDSQEYIYDDGNIFCDGCRKTFCIIDCTFACNEHPNDFRAFDETRIENILSAVATFPGTESESKEFRRKLKRSIRQKWKEVYGCEPD